jgi:glycosyltransferase involved in cell wall biosynthesis
MFRLGTPSRWRIGAAIPSLAAYLHRSAPDVVMAGNNPACFLTEVAHRLARAPRTHSVLCITNHLSGSGNSGSAAKQAVLHRVLRWADAVVAVGGDVARDLEQTIPGIAATVHTIHEPVIPDDLDALQAEPAPHPWFEDGGAPVVVGCGRFEAQKDFATLLHAFSLAREQTAVRLVLIGEGREQRSLENLAASLGVERDVAFLGRIENPFSALARADLFVLSSVWEGLPNVLIEAMACACPVISTDAPGGARDVLLNGALGPLTPPGDPHAMAAAIVEVLSKPPNTAPIVARGREFSEAKSIDAYSDLFRTLVSH